MTNPPNKSIEVIARELAECNDIMPKTLKEYQDKVYRVALYLIHVYKSKLLTEIGKMKGEAEEKIKKYSLISDLESYRNDDVVFGYEKSLSDVEAKIKEIEI